MSPTRPNYTSNCRGVSVIRPLVLRNFDAAALSKFVALPLNRQDAKIILHVSAAVQF